MVLRLQLIDKGGYLEMKREYIKPEAEMTKFVETEELMADPASILGAEYGVWDGTIDPNWKWN